MTNYEQWLPVARKLVNGLASKPGIRIVNKTIAAELLAQALNGLQSRGEFPPRENNREVR